MRTSSTSSGSSCRWRAARPSSGGSTRTTSSASRRSSPPAAAPPGRGRRGVIQHVTLELRREDAPAEARFWELLGLRGVEPPAGVRERSLWLERDGTQVHLAYESGAGHPRARARRRRGARLRGDDRGAARRGACRRPARGALGRRPRVRALAGRAHASRSWPPRLQLQQLDLAADRIALDVVDELGADREVADAERLQPASQDVGCVRADPCGLGGRAPGSAAGASRRDARRPGTRRAPRRPPVAGECEPGAPVASGRCRPAARRCRSCDPRSPRCGRTCARTGTAPR